MRVIVSSKDTTDETAAKVCRDIGIDVTGILTGTEIEKLDDDALAAAIPATTIFARVGPDQKSRLIKIARRTGVDVAFLCDGVNDAVALHAADVGISVDSATEVAKDAADIVLLDKDLGVLADGTEHVDPDRISNADSLRLQRFGRHPGQDPQIASVPSGRRPRDRGEKA